mmetsp:Transcript_16679/g.31634  ORF Transcript_16679/g.31634 Transcript_16679/m.31634 type:complete len:124 (-) Transcript_16679:447-818(-)|eukprot:CAMPEP_0170175904 /NCGR_PEP_ID=MMETSP0040_2-20121228/8889_1 /TAXON_ID=641309 /ORGANISM="Lotharella oceanica, Strain CCMP622" /LENGTH=123 /DNA_ID=CAMNT_0010418043 /DNA_START=43 /DNA_END=414 /DNA_ORIENTATION=-
MGASPCLPERCAGACPGAICTESRIEQPLSEDHHKNDALEAALQAVEEQLQSAERRMEQKDLRPPEAALMATNLARVASVLKGAHQGVKLKDAHRAPNSDATGTMKLTYAGTSVGRRTKPREA